MMKPSALDVADLTIDIETLATITGGKTESQSTFECGPFLVGMYGPNRTTATDTRDGSTHQWKNDNKTPWYVGQNENMVWGSTKDHQLYPCSIVSGSR